MSFKNRIFGSVIVRAINSNYNADFSHQPRTLPDGTVYATDKAFKYAVKNYLKDVYPAEKVFYFKRFRPNVDDFVPFSLMEAFCSFFPELAEIEKAGTKDEKIKLKATKKQVGKSLLDCIDIRLFGATFAMKGKSKEENLSISLHGPVQINHGINVWHESNIYSEQIMSPFRNPSDEKDESEKAATSLGRQSKLQEGHYVHHFSINPKNLSQVVGLAGDGAKDISAEDISKLQEAMRRGVTYYDSASKAGSENEALFWVQLKEGSNLVLPNFTQLIKMEKEKVDGKVVLDCRLLKETLVRHETEIEKVQIFFNEMAVQLKNQPDVAEELSI
ncbi:CRISPR-associated protein, Csh2 family [Fulvivirga imtechensis AK7]|uniref:CRISPR-associated protein, Csh2 family n=1 Tax=Fulvivirga imtechensis AK7 TaxID=1237149 RepID=L8JXR4_9BACT|nr:type I CRISPR-associated protein Cas7 [Fulvivirga imtechensis]ELR72968.1 CRISPR-associated protein, Csh2 family [Fulvivirga imtechensis AK7]